MEITCPHCLGTRTSPATGETCYVCGGDGTIEADGTHGITEAYVIAAYEKIVELETKLNNIDTKLDTIDLQLDAIELKIDELLG